MNELFILGLTKNIISAIPLKLKSWVAKILYNYDSNKIKGVDLILNSYQGNLKIFINTKEYIGWNIYFKGNYEEFTNYFLKKYIKPDDIVIEAGANNGSESVIIGNILSNGEGKLYAFEPIMEFIKRLRINILLNDLTNVVIPIPVALGENISLVDFYLMNEKAVNQGMSSKFKYKEAQRNVKVKQVTLDNWLEKIK